MPPGLSGSPPSFSRRAYYNRPSCNHQPSLSLSASLRAFDIHIAADTNSLTHYSPPPLLNKANKCTLWLFFFLFTRCRRCCSVLREGRKEVEGRFSLLMDWKRSREEIGGSGSGNRGCCDIGYWLFSAGSRMDGIGFGPVCARDDALSVCVYVCV